MTIPRINRNASPSQPCPLVQRPRDARSGRRAWCELHANDLGVEIPERASLHRPSGSSGRPASARFAGQVGSFRKGPRLMCQRRVRYKRWRGHAWRVRSWRQPMMRSSRIEKQRQVSGRRRAQSRGSGQCEHSSSCKASSEPSVRKELCDCDNPQQEVRRAKDPRRRSSLTSSRSSRRV